MKVFKSKDRYLTKIDWLESYHSFSFGEHYHPNNKGWGNLRVINEDYIAPGGSFATHPHRDMEIISYIAKGELHHKDSQGNEYTVHEGEVQRISAGSGIQHSETNSSNNETTQLFQLWVKPKIKQTEPNYKQITLNGDDKINSLQLIASENGDNGSIDIKQDTEIYVSKLSKGKNINYEMKRAKAWVQIISGSLELQSLTLEQGDGLALSKQENLTLLALEDCHFLLFDLSG